MQEKTKNILIVALLVGIISMTVVYAALSQTLNISGSARVQAKDNSWNIHFAHLATLSNEVTTSGYATCAASQVTLDGTSTTITLPEVTLKAPGDKVVFKFNVINEGDITGKITNIGSISKGTVSYGNGETMTSSEKTAFENAIKVYFDYSNDTAIALNDTLTKNQTKELRVTIEFENTVATQLLPSAGATLSNITASLTYGQS